MMEPKVSQTVCQACQRVIDVHIKRGNCASANGIDSQVMQPGSLEERCTFVADAIANNAERLLEEFKAAVCPCLGCCGDAKCYFPNVEDQWLSTLISNVQDSVMSQMKEDGWEFITDDFRRVKPDQ